jgi:hypothetical protein
MSDTKVIFIGGHGRSGTTIVDRVLSELTGAFSAGEVHRFWKYGLAQDWRCSCGDVLRNCSFWSTVLPQVFSETGYSEKDVLEMWNTVARPRSLVFLHYPSIRPPLFRKRLATYRIFLRTFYRVVAEQAGTDIVVDSSGSPMHGYILSGLRDVHVQMLHLIRDVRAVAFSNHRRKPDPSHPSPNATTDTKPVARVAVTWLLYNDILERLSDNFSTGLSAKYEHIFSSPKTSLRHLARTLANLNPVREDIFDTERKIELGAHHSGQGNPARYQTGEVILEVDSEWRSKMSNRQRQFLKTLCYPKLRKYGYG